jgi:hypothetical protein
MKPLPPILPQIEPKESGDNARVNKQYNQRSDECHEPARRVALLVHAGHSADKAAQPSTYQAQEHGQYQAHMLLARHNSASYQTNEQPENGVSDHVQHLDFLLLS